MDMKDFKKGTRIQVLRDLFRDDGTLCLAKGETGIIVDETLVDHPSTRAWTRWDNYNSNLHNSGGRCENGHGWAVSVDEVELETEPVQKLNRYQILKNGIKDA